MPLNAAARNIRLRRLIPRLPRWMLIPAVIILAALLWSIGALWHAAALLGGCLALVAVLTWWRWVTRQQPPRRPTLFVLRHRQQRAVRLLRAAAESMARDATTADALAQRLDGSTPRTQPDIRLDE